jgi:maltodextrin utilization protein YvdJ
MKRLLPSLTEVAVLATFSILCAAIASFSSALDLALAGLSLPIFIVAAVMGLQRHVRNNVQPQTVVVVADESSPQ